MMPKRIIQTAKSKDLPLRDKAATVNLRLLNPDYEQLFFDDTAVERFIDTEFPQYRAVFDAFPVRIQRYDFFRYLAVYRFGGFYFDTDVLLAKGLDDLLERDCVFPFEQLSVHGFLGKRYGMDWEIGNYAFGAKAGHPFLLAIINNCVRAQQQPDWADEMIRGVPALFRREWSILATTGPAMVTRTLAEYARGDVTVLFPDDVCNRDNWYRFGDYGVHLAVGSWRTKPPLIPRLLHRIWETATRKMLLKGSLALGKTRLHSPHGTVTRSRF